MFTNHLVFGQNLIITWAGWRMTGPFIAGVRPTYIFRVGQLSLVEGIPCFTRDFTELVIVIGNAAHDFVCLYSWYISACCMEWILVFNFSVVFYGIITILSMSVRLFYGFVNQITQIFFPGVLAWLGSFVGFDFLLIRFEYALFCVYYKNVNFIWKEDFLDPV